MADDGALRLEMAALLPRLRRFALGLTRAPDQADDLVQATLERAIRGLDGFTPGTRLDSWMYRIMQNLHRNALRDHAVRMRHVEQAGAQGEPSLDGAVAVEARADLQTVGTALEGLDPDQRTALMLVGVEGLSYQEAAEIMEVPIGTLTSRLARARLRLRAALDDAPPSAAAPAGPGRGGEEGG